VTAPVSPKTCRKGSWEKINLRTKGHVVMPSCVRTLERKKDVHLENKLLEGKEKVKKHSRPFQTSEIALSAGNRST